MKKAARGAKPQNRGPRGTTGADGWTPEVRGCSEVRVYARPTGPLGGMVVSA